MIMMLFYEKNIVIKDMFFFKCGNKQMINDFLIFFYINVGQMVLIGFEFCRVDGIDRV